MVRKIALFFILFAGVSCQAAYSQEDSFCNAVTTIMRDAPNKFRNIKGKMIESNFNVITWASGITVPGTIGSRFVASMGLFYEGAFLQASNKDDLKALYDKYKDLLNKCLCPDGYTLSFTDNFYAGLSDYKKVVFMPALKDDEHVSTVPPHVTMEATYSKDVGKYTLVMYIFEH